MTLQELINAVMLKATGKPTILDKSNTKWEKIRGIANYYQKAWAHEPGQHWNSLYSLEDIGTVYSDAFDLPDYVEEVSTANGDNPWVRTLEGKNIPFKIVEHDDWQKNLTGNHCFLRGRQIILLFNGSVLDSPCYGGTLRAPVYYKVPELVEDYDEVVVDIPEWLVTMCAAEYIRNDIVKQNQYGNLVAEANNLMSTMIKNNRGGRVRHVRGSFRNGGGLNYD